jgi:hypothetical protein
MNHNPHLTTPASGATTAGLPAILDVETIRNALTDGTATPLTKNVTSLVVYGGQWWMELPDSWILITDEDFITTLNARHARRGWA